MQEEGIRVFRKYPKIYRIDVGLNIRGKYYLSDQEIMNLLDGEVVIEEKVDGKLIEVEFEGYTIYKEDMRRQHTVVYDGLPAFEIGLDVWDGERFLGVREKTEIFQILNIVPAPILFQAEIAFSDLITFLGRKSEFGSGKIEGIVIKNYLKQLFGKVVDPAFDDTVDNTVHHLRRLYTRNKLKELSHGLTIE